MGSLVSDGSLCIYKLNNSIYEKIADLEFDSTFKRIDNFIFADEAVRFFVALNQNKSSANKALKSIVISGELKYGDFWEGNELTNSGFEE